jgi:hypothetical protein
VSPVRRFALVVLLVHSAAALAWTSAPAVFNSPDSNQSTVTQGNESPQAPANQSPAAPVVDPAAAVFPKTATAGLLLVTVKPDRVADYEAVIRALQDGLSRSDDPRQQALARGWRVYKSHDDPKANAVFVHVIDPVVPQADYRPSLILDEILAGASAELLAKYRDAIASAPAMLGMNEFAVMSQPPPKPTNGSPPGPQ